MFLVHGANRHTSPSEISHATGVIAASGSLRAHQQCHFHALDFVYQIISVYQIVKIQSQKINLYIFLLKNALGGTILYLRANRFPIRLNPLKEGGGKRRILSKLGKMAELPKDRAILRHVRLF